MDDPLDLAPTRPIRTVVVLLDWSAYRPGSNASMRCCVHWEYPVPGRRLRLCTNSVHQRAASDVDSLSGDIACLVTGQEYSDLSHLRWRAQPP